MSEIEKAFDFHVETYCKLFNVKRDEVLSPNREERNSRARVMIFVSMNELFPGKWPIIRNLLKRKHPYHYFALKVHSESMSLYEYYRIDYNQYLTTLAGGAFDDELLHVAKRMLGCYKSDVLVDRIVFEHSGCRIMYKSGRTVCL